MSTALFILFLILLVATAVAWFTMPTSTYPKLRGSLAIATVIVLVVQVLFSAVNIIDSGTFGVKRSWGKIDPETIQPGIALTIPWAQSITVWSGQISRAHDDKSAAASKDLQNVTTSWVLAWRYNPRYLPFVATEIGDGMVDNIILPAVQESLKAVSSEFTAEELITKRESVRAKVLDKIRQKVVAKGVIVEEFSIINFAFDPAFAEAVEAKTTAGQLKLKASTDLERIRIENEQRLVSAQTEAESLRLQKENVTDDLIRLRQIEMQQRAIDKWDGVLPNVNSGVLPFIDVTTKR